MLFHKLVEEFQKFRYTNLDQAKEVVTRMKQLETENDAFAYQSMFYEAQLCYQEEKFDEGLSLAIECISHLVIRPYCIELGKSYNLIGIIYVDKGDVFQAIDYFLNAIELVKKNQDEETACFIYNNLGCTFNHLNDYETAIVYFKKAYLITESISVNPHVSMILALNLALMYSDVEDFEEAKHYYDIANKCEKENNIETNQILCSIILIKIAYSEKDFMKIYNEMDTIAKVIEKDGITIDDFKELVKLIRQIMTHQLKNKLDMILLLLDKVAIGQDFIDAYLDIITCKIEYCKMIEDKEKVNNLLNEFYLVSVKKERENEKAFIESANVKLQMQAVIQLQREAEENSRKYKEIAERDELTGLYNRTI